MDAMLVQMSVSASLIIAAALCIRALALCSLPKRVFQLLWGIAAVRLLLPFRVPCRFSFYTVLSLLEAPGTQTMAGEAAGISALWRPPGIQTIEMEAYAKYYGAPLSAAEWVWILGIFPCGVYPGQKTVCILHAGGTGNGGLTTSSAAPPGANTANRSGGDPLNVRDIPPGDPFPNGHGLGGPEKPPCPYP